jgi:hypothetical protein
LRITAFVERICGVILEEKRMLKKLRKSSYGVLDAIVIGFFIEFRQKLGLMRRGF